MDSSTVLQKKIDEVLYLLAKTLVDAMLEYRIGRETAKRVARYILREKEAISSEKDLRKFLTKVKELHPIFEKEIELKVKEEEAKQQDAEKIEEIKTKLMQLTGSL